MRLLYFSPVPADSYAQRPHFMARAWLDWGAESVLWVNPYPCRLPRWRDFVARIERSKLHRENGSKAKKTKVGSVSIDPPFDSGLDARVRVIAAPALPVEPLPGGAWWNRRFLWRGAWREIEQFAMTDTLVIGIGRPCALALEAIRRLVPAASFYDAMDNFPEFYGGLSRRALRRREDAIAAEVDLVVASSSFLAEKFARRGLRVETIFNACEGTSTLQISQTPRPAIPVLGYVGCIGDWFDWPLVARLAEALPEARIELIGPCAAPPRRTPPANVRLLPACSQSDSLGHLARFSAGIIPFRVNALTAGVDPIKYYEYRAAGLPVLSTRFGEMNRRSRGDGVHFLEENGELAGVVRAALADRPDARATDRFRRENHWRFRFQQCTMLRSLAPDARKLRAA